HRQARAAERRPEKCVVHEALAVRIDRGVAGLEGPEQQASREKQTLAPRDEPITPSQPRQERRVAIPRIVCPPPPSKYGGEPARQTDEDDRTESERRGQRPSGDPRQHPGQPGGQDPSEAAAQSV